jgi:AraC family transcriptional regulator of arabinose operon
LDDIAISSHQSDTANLLYDILDRRPVTTPRLERASAWFEQLDTPIDRRSFMAYLQVLQGEKSIQHPLAELVPRWRHARGKKDSFSDKDAAAFLQDYLARLDPNLLFSTPITAGYAYWDRARLQSGFSYASHSELSWSLLYCDLGGAQLRGGGRDLPIIAGQVLLVAPGALYTLQPQQGFAEWGYHWVVFHPDSAWRDWLSWPRFVPQVSSLSLPEPAQKQLVFGFKELQACLQSSQAMRPELSHNLLEQLILRCRASLPADFQPQRDPRIERARRFIEEHCTTNFTLEQVAHAASLSASRLAGLFRQQCGLSVLGYRDELRMVRAAQLLRNHTLAIAEIGASVGYPDPAYFSRTFSRHIGTSPRSYRNSGRQLAD